MRRIAIFSVMSAMMLSTVMAEDFNALLSALDYGKSSPRPTQPAVRTATNRAEMPKLAAPKVAAKLVSNKQQTQTVSYNSGCAAGGCDSGCVNGNCAGGNCGNGNCGPGGCGLGRGLCNSGRCGQGGYCTPHNTPNIPGSTLRQYWKSNACNCNVWDGYQNECKPPLSSRLTNLGRNGGCGGAGCGGCADCAGRRCDNGQCDGLVTNRPLVAPVAPCDSPSVVAQPLPAVPCDSPAGCDAPATTCDAPGGCDSPRW